MKPLHLARTCCFLLGTGLLLFNLTALGQNKEIRLRTGSITTHTRRPAAVAAGADTASSAGFRPVPGPV